MIKIDFDWKKCPDIHLIPKLGYQALVIYKNRHVWCHVAALFSEGRGWSVYIRVCEARPSPTHFEVHRMLENHDATATEADIYLTYKAVAEQMVIEELQRVKEALA